MKKFLRLFPETTNIDFLICVSFCFEVWSAFFCRLHLFFQRNFGKILMFSWFFENKLQKNSTISD